MKPLDEMTLEEQRELLVAEETRARARRAYYGRSGSARRELIERDPKAYFTRRRDFEDAEKRGQDTSWVPKLNVTTGGKV